MINVLTLITACLTFAPQSELQLRQELRRDATRWLRARQHVLVPCEACAGKGLWPRRGFVMNGKLRPRRPHRTCRGSGRVFSRRSHTNLFRSYLEDAKTLPGLGRGRLTETEVRRFLWNQTLPRSQRLEELAAGLGTIDPGISAQVSAVVLDQRGRGPRMATVLTTVDPKRTRWARIGRRWVVVDRADEARLRRQTAGSTVEGAAQSVPSTGAPR